MVFYLDSVYFAETINVPIFENEIIARKAHKRGNTQGISSEVCVCYKMVHKHYMTLQSFQSKENFL